jgi:hypothetical protein
MERQRTAKHQCPRRNVVDGQHQSIVQLPGAHQRSTGEQRDDAQCRYDEQHDDEQLRFHPAQQFDHLDRRHYDRAQRDQLVDVEQDAVIWLTQTTQPEANDQRQDEKATGDGEWV